MGPKVATRIPHSPQLAPKTLRAVEKRSWPARPSRPPTPLFPLGQGVESGAGACARRAVSAKRSRAQTIERDYKS